MIWTSKAQTINVMLHYLGKNEIDNFDELRITSKIEKICYLRFFLETEGSLFLELANRYYEKKEIKYTELKNSIKNIFETITNNYLDLAFDFREQVRIREL